uniref:lytic murein transglycosylase n=1 Tax=Paraconexibacter sp. TaxID=2949640 RepID=UPI0035652332
PPFLLPIYQAAGIEYGIRWEILAAINEIETDYGRNLNVSSAGALGWMQFMPPSWKAYGVDANRDGKKDPYNPVDAIFAAARYLKAAGADDDIRKAIFAYNHADWYVDSVLMRARLIGGLPADLVGSLTGLTQGHFPVHAKATYADDLSEKDAKTRVKKGQNAAKVVESAVGRRGIDIFAKPGSPVIAVQDGKIVKIGQTKRLGKFIQLRDVYGNTYTYAQLKKVAVSHPVPKVEKVSKDAVAKELALPKDAKPTAPASAGSQTAKASKQVLKAASSVSSAASSKERLFANPSRPHAYKAGGDEQLLNAGEAIGESTTFKSYFTEIYGLKKDDVVLKRLKVGSKVIAGTILGRIGKSGDGSASHVKFEIRPAGRGAPRIDPKPILDGWKLLESTAVYRAAGKNPFFGPDSKNPTIGQILLMSKEALQKSVLEDPRIEIYGCGRRDIKAGIIDRRVLATLSFLSASGLKPTVTSLQCGHSLMTKSGNISEHSTGTAIDIAKINGIPILGHQGAGSVTELTIRRLLTLQGTMKPHQIISLMTFDGADNTIAMPDHADHIHIGFRPLYTENGKLAKQLNSALKPSQWIKLIDRLGDIDNPTVATTPSKYAIDADKNTKIAGGRASRAHRGE